MTKVGKADVGLLLKLPEVSVTLAAKYDKAGVCSQNAGSSKTGVKLSSDVSITVSAEVELKVGEDEDEHSSSWSKDLYNWTHPLGPLCYPLDIPGFGSKPSATQVPTISSPGSSSSTTPSGLSSSISLSVPSALPVVNNSDILHITSGKLTTGRHDGIWANVTTTPIQCHRQQSQSSSNYTSYGPGGSPIQSSILSSGTSYKTSTNYSGKDSSSSASNSGRFTKSTFITSSQSSQTALPSRTDSQKPSDHTTSTIPTAPSAHVSHTSQKNKSSSVTEPTQYTPSPKKQAEPGDEDSSLTSSKRESSSSSSSSTSSRHSKMPATHPAKTRTGGGGGCKYKWVNGKGMLVC